MTLVFSMITVATALIGWRMAKKGKFVAEARKLIKKFHLESINTIIT
jgi:hypothetical protein